MEFSEQLDLLHKGFIQGVRATLQYQFDDIGVKVSPEQFNNAVRTILKSRQWSDKTIDVWLSK